MRITVIKSDECVLFHRTGSIYRIRLIKNATVVYITEGHSPSTNMEGHIEFSGIHFSYPSRPEVSIFNGLDLVVPIGSVTAVVGSSGSGKSTLPALLMRFYDPTSGVLKIDGNNVQDFSPQWLRTHMSIVHQVLTFFRSIEDRPQM